MSSQSLVQKKGHIVLVPFPAQGHINPFMQLAKLLHSTGFYVTFVNTEFNHARLLRSKGPDFFTDLSDFRFEAIPDGLPPSDRDATQEVWALCDSLRNNCFDPFRNLLAKLNLNPELGRVSCIISDGVMGFATKIAQEFGIPDVQFWTASACGFMGYLQFNELIHRGIVPFKDTNFTNDGTLETPIDWIEGMSNMKLKDIPSFIRTTNPDDIMLNFLKDEAENCLKASKIVFNTFDELEHEALNAIRAKIPHMYNIGPLCMLENHIPSSRKQSTSDLKLNLWKEDFRCLDWLDKRNPGSVMYVNYGSITVMSEEDFKEFAWGLANSNHPFLWIVRADGVRGDSEILPEEYYEEIKERGLIANWCRQDQVLSHPSIGAFLTHCGWNSTLESLSNGVPLLCWPFFGEQPTNCRYSCTTWGIGMEIDGEIKRSEIEKLVKEMMETEKGKVVKENALEWKRKAEIATKIGGSSYQDFNRFIQEILL
ncbi:linamarin synthase 1-like [Mercurialis annua]|uniref:linamarin synthase 1-like n=1 Tax=Mercurialis annua TaxID=3986 RepID=UPI00215F581C|nr:linamarin synthase 1-like [Mercurialis annua]